MPYAVVIVAEKNSPGLLEDIAPSFASLIATIRKLQIKWILESSTFEPSESEDTLYEAANKLLSNIHRVLALYLGLLGEPLSVGSLISLNDNDEVISRRLYGTLRVAVVRPAQLLNPTASGSLGTAVLSKANVDGAVQEALSLVGLAAPT